MIMCQDPTFIGSSVYANLNYKTQKLSRVVTARERVDGSVGFSTKHADYMGDFSSDRAKRAFVDNCRTTGVLLSC